MAKMNGPELTAKITMPGFTAEASLLKNGESYRRFSVYHQGTTTKRSCHNVPGSVGATTTAIVTGRAYLS
jgi:hypothetical protein